MNIPLIRIYFIALFCMVLSNSKAQSGYFKIDTIRPIDKNDRLSFPILSNKHDSLACEKINQYLQRSELHLIKGQKNMICLKR